MKISKIHVNFSVLTKIPRNLFEVITIFLLILVMIYIQPDKSSLNELIPIFGLYGVVIIRLIPLFTQINQNVQMIDSQIIKLMK